MPFIIMQQQQPADIIFIMQSQQAWIISQQALSPEVQVTMQPSAVASHLHMPMVSMQVIMGMPFIIMQQLIMPPCIMVIMFCIIVHCILSSQVHMIFIPPSMVDIIILQRGIIIMFIMGMAPIMFIGLVPIMPMPISFIRPVVIVFIRKLQRFGGVLRAADDRSHE